MAVVGDVVNGVVSVAGSSSTTVTPASGEVWHITEIGSGAWIGGEWGYPNLDAHQKNASYSAAFYRGARVMSYRSTTGAYVDNSNYFSMNNLSGSSAYLCYTGMRVE